MSLRQMLQVKRVYKQTTPGHRDNSFQSSQMASDGFSGSSCGEKYPRELQDNAYRILTGTS